MYLADEDISCNSNNECTGKGFTEPAIPPVTIDDDTTQEDIDNMADDTAVNETCKYTIVKNVWCMYILIN